MKWIKADSEKNLIEIIKAINNVCVSYPQTFGDCYEVNSTACKVLNEFFPNRFQIAQMIVYLDSKVLDTDENIGWTDEPHHIMVYDTIAIGIEDYAYDKNFLDFSTVLGDAWIEEVEMLGTLGGSIDNALYDKIKDKLK